MMAIMSDTIFVKYCTCTTCVVSGNVIEEKYNITPHRTLTVKKCNLYCRLIIRSFFFLLLLYYKKKKKIYIKKYILIKSTCNKKD